MIHAEQKEKIRKALKIADEALMDLDGHDQGRLEAAGYTKEALALLDEPEAGELAELEHMVISTALSVVNGTRKQRDDRVETMRAAIEQYLEAKVEAQVDCRHAPAPSAPRPEAGERVNHLRWDNEKIERFRDSLSYMRIDGTRSLVDEICDFAKKALNAPDDRVKALVGLLCYHYGADWAEQTMTQVTDHGKSFMAARAAALKAVQGEGQ